MNTPPSDHDESEVDRLLASLEQHRQQSSLHGPEVHFGMVAAYVNGTMTDPHERDVVERAIGAWHHWSEAYRFLESRRARSTVPAPDTQAAPLFITEETPLAIANTLSDTNQQESATPVASPIRWESEFREALIQERPGIPDEKDWPLLTQIYRSFRNSGEPALRPRDIANAPGVAAGVASELAIRRFAKRAASQGLVKHVQIQPVRGTRPSRGMSNVDAFAPVASPHRLLAGLCLAIGEIGQLDNCASRIHELAEAMGIAREESQVALHWAATILNDPGCMDVTS